ncbi:MAG: segregation/condensation protein A [Gammaproteobacteria bacterium]|nr:segregation/condensation protein A [Gammaproteobacteria bacterium]
MNEPSEKAASEQSIPSTHHVQEEMPFAIVKGEAVSDVPKDLYIPPDALEVILEIFEGPLDLLLYLIRRQNLDIKDIPLADITAQYMKYVDLMKDLHLELAAEYLVMAAMLAEIKSRVLLPRPASLDEDEDDPRADLIRRLQEYEQFKQAAENLDELPRSERDTFQSEVEPPDFKIVKQPVPVDMKELMIALTDVLSRAEMFSSHHIQKDVLSVREKMSMILNQLKPDRFTSFIDLFDPEEGRMGVVVSFMGIMELIKETLIEIIQHEPYGPIHVKAAGASTANDETIESSTDENDEPGERKSDE